MLKISVIIPSFNQGQYIEETLRSVTEQGYPNLELIVIDGASTDQSVDIIRKYEDRISFWISEKDKGQSDAINKGFQRATGDIITWLCSDDLFTPGTLHKVNEHFSSLPTETGLIHGGVVVFSKAGDDHTDFGYPDPSVERYISGMAFSQPGAFFRKKYLDLVNGRVSEALHYGMDYDLFARLACVCQFKAVPDVYARYRLHEESKSVSQQDRFIVDWCRVYLNLCDHLGWTETANLLRSVSPLKDAFSYSMEHDFSINPSIFEKVDQRKSLFYHLSYQLRALYAAGNIKDSKRILLFLQKNYPAAWIAEEKRVPYIARKLQLPTLVLLTLRKVKSWI